MLSISTGASHRARSRFVASGEPLAGVDALVLLATTSDDGPALLPTRAATAQLREQIAGSLGAVGFAGKPGQLARIPLSASDGPSGATVVGVSAQPSEEELLGAIGSGVRASSGAERLVVDVDVDAAAGLLRAALATYRFTEYRPALADGATRDVALVADGAPDSERIADLAAAVCFARDLVTLAPADKTPERVAEIIQTAAAQVGAECRIYDEAEIRDLGMGGLLAVSRASAHPPRLVRLDAPGAGDARVAVVGKGLTYDAGGLNLKLAMLESMKLDIGGAAAAAAAALYLAAHPGRAGLTVWLPLCENVTSGNAYRGGDVLRMRSGLTVEVMNTDAEGRLVLADAMSLAADERPVALVTIATLTGAAWRALGARTAALMSADDALAERVLAAAAAGHEDVWRMPMRAHFGKTLESKIADLNNLGDAQNGQTMVAAAFLSRFAPDDLPFAHFDIAGPAYNHGEAYDHVPAAGTGFGVATLVELLNRPW
ncbi:MAG TPA: leucyl aminopeptidase family protein [Mycobacteriales bacterium]|nr:leucyl aminopeptidase family protein [Mycobacteriales bacterium]